MAATNEQSEAPQRPAAFINAIADEGTKAEAVEWLQKTWNELCQAQDALRSLRSATPANARAVAEATMDAAYWKDRSAHYLKTIRALRETQRPWNALAVAEELCSEANRLERENIYAAQGITRDWLRGLAAKLRATLPAEPQPSQAVLDAYTKCAEICGESYEGRNCADAILAARDALKGKP